MKATACTLLTARAEIRKSRLDYLPSLRVTRMARAIGIMRI